MRITAIALACAVSLPLISFPAQSRAQSSPSAPDSGAAPAAGAPTGGAPIGAAPAASSPAAAAAAPTAPVIPENQSLAESVEDFWHFGKIARYDVAAAEGQHILSLNAPPPDLLSTFETVAQNHHDNVDEWLLRWQGVDQMHDVSTSLISALNKGHNARREDPKYIEQNIQLIATNQRGYDIGIDRLRDSGELAVPIMLDYLRDPAQSQYHGAIRRALRDLGLPAVNPLLAATAMHDEQTLMTVVTTLGDIGYDVAVPYLARLLQVSDVPSSVKATTVDALRRMRVPDPMHLSATDLFYDLAEKFYYDNAAVRAERRFPTAYIWQWDDKKGLTKTDVPQPIFHAIMAKRAAEFSLKLGDAQGDALSLWLAAAFLDESLLPPGQTDPTIPSNSPAAHYYGVAAGTKYLNNTLSRANRDRNAPVAMQTILAMQDIGGQANLFANGPHPLMDALQFPERLVRYQAAFALASALPTRSFSGEENVVPLLSDALNQSSAPNVLVLIPSQDALNGLVAALRTQGCNAVGGTTPEQAAASAGIPATIDAILIDEDAGPTAIDKFSLLINQSSKLQRAVKVVVTKTKASPYTAQATNNPMLSTTQAQLSDGPGLRAALDGARKRAGMLPLDPAEADRYATRAADLLAKIAVNRSPVFDLTVALNTLLGTLDDPRPQIVKDDATVLGLINSPEIQPALLQKAADAKMPDELKIALYKAVATNSRNFGNHLAGNDVESLERVVASGPSVPVRTAAAEARGALNLPADEAKQLIINQSPTPN